MGNPHGGGKGLKNKALVYNRLDNRPGLTGFEYLEGP